MQTCGDHPCRRMASFRHLDASHRRGFGSSAVMHGAVSLGLVGNRAWCHYSHSDHSRAECWMGSSSCFSYFMFNPDSLFHMNIDAAYICSISRHLEAIISPSNKWNADAKNY